MATVTPSTLVVEKHAVPGKGAQSPADSAQPGKHTSPLVAVPTHALCSPRALPPDDPRPVQSDETEHGLVHHSPLQVRPVSHAPCAVVHESPTPSSVHERHDVPRQASSCVRDDMPLGNCCSHADTHDESVQLASHSERFVHCELPAQRASSWQQLALAHATHAVSPGLDVHAAASSSLNPPAPPAAGETQPASQTSAGGSGCDEHPGRTAAHSALSTIAAIAANAELFIV